MQIKSADIMFNELNELVKSNEAFYKQEFVLDGHIYWIYNYRLASYTDFLAPSALEARGIMFEVNADGTLVRLASLPFSKFFNHKENPMTMDLDFSNFQYCVDKLDGSLINTYIHEGELRVKTKGSLFSEQAVASQKLLEDVFHNLKCALTSLEDEGWCTSLEYTAPTNRIVIGYAKPELTVLAVRNRVTGAYMDRKILKHDVILSKYLVKDYNDMVNEIGVDKFVDSIPDMPENIEGYIFMLSSGQLVKHKTNKYLALHHTKDSITTPRRLYECVVNEAADDLRMMFPEDLGALQLINDMEEKVHKIYNHMVKSVEDFYNTNKGLERKDYAIKGQAELDRKFFNLAMMKFLQKELDYKGFMIKEWKTFGIKDDPVVNE